MSRQQTLFLFLLLLLLAGVSAWLQFAVLEKFGEEISASASESQSNDPDYYIENFTSTGRDRLGKKYQLSAERLVHYPRDGNALLVRPHIIQYRSEGAPRHIYADTGQLNAADEVLLSGNVRVIDDPSGAGGTVATSQKMLIRLKRARG